MTIQKILFDLHYDALSGWEWRMIARYHDGSIRIQARSSKLFATKADAEQNICEIVSTLSTQYETLVHEDEVTITPEKFVNPDTNRVQEVHRIARPREQQQRKDLE